MEKCTDQIVRSNDKSGNYVRCVTNIESRMFIQLGDRNILSAHSLFQYRQQTE